MVAALRLTGDLRSFFVVSLSNDSTLGIVYAFTMYVRYKTSSDKRRKYVQIVEGYYVGDSTRQRVIRHIGSASNDEELEELFKKGELVKAQILDERQPGIFSPEEMASMAVEYRKWKQPDWKAIQEELDSGEMRKKGEANFRREQAEMEKRFVTGIHEVYGQVYRDIGLDHVLPRRSYYASSDAMYHLTMARTVSAVSKRRSVQNLKEQFGINVPLASIYRMMDLLDDQRIERIIQLVCDASHALQPDSAGTCMYLYRMKSSTWLATENGVYQKGKSKELKNSEPHAFLVLVVSREGLPLNFEILQNVTGEGYSPISELQGLKRRHQVEKIACITDRGELDESEQVALNAFGDHFIAGVNLRSLPEEMRTKILDAESYRPLPGADDKWVAESEIDGRRLVVEWHPERAKNDEPVFRETAERPVSGIAQDEGHGDVAPDCNAHHLSSESERSGPTADDRKKADTVRWSELTGVVTSDWEMSAEEVLLQSRRWWTLGECFHITKRERQIGSVYHWSPERMRSHIAISFVACACRQHLAHRVAKHAPLMSQERMHQALVNHTTAVFRQKRGGGRYSIPGNPRGDAKAIYEAMGIKPDTKIRRID